MKCIMPNEHKSTKMSCANIRLIKLPTTSCGKSNKRKEARPQIRPVCWVERDKVWWKNVAKKNHALSTLKLSVYFHTYGCQCMIGWCRTFDQAFDSCLYNKQDLDIREEHWHPNKTTKGRSLFQPSLAASCSKT